MFSDANLGLHLKGLRISDLPSIAGAMPSAATT